MRALSLLIAAALALAVAGCTGGDGSDPSPSPTTASPTAGPGETETGTVTQTCTSQADGYAVRYPETWHTNDPAEHEPCRWFHPEPFTLPEAQEATGIAIHLDLVAQPYGEMRELVREGPSEIVSDEEREAGEHEALRLELRSTGEALLPEGTLTTQWVVDFDSRTMIASTHDVAEAGSYADNVAVLDAMMQSLERVETATACSAEGMSPQPEPQDDLPEPVAETRRRVYEAAVACDWQRLAELIPAGGFTYSFGGGDEPIAYWQRQERDEQGPPPMRYLAGMLQRPYATRDVRGQTQYEWPSAFTYDSWRAVPERDREALRPLYDDEDFEDFARFGGYIGYRITIDVDGVWRTFVAGD